jgi:hypothetical protein
VLARLPLLPLLLLAAFVTLVVCLGVHRWVRAPRLTAGVFAVSVLCCLGMVAVGAAQYQHWNVRQMLVCYSFTWAGFALGFLPSRRYVLSWADDWRRGIRRERYDYPARYRATVYTSVVVMALLGYVLSI